MKPIPISAAIKIARDYGYDQIVIVARKVDQPEQGGGEHVTTAGVDPAHCEVAARIGDFIKHRLMAWPVKDPRGLAAACRAFADRLETEAPR